MPYLLLSLPSLASPCLLEKTPDSTFKPCVDFHKINAINLPDTYLLPATVMLFSNLNAQYSYFRDSLI